MWKWQQKLGDDATYNNLISVFERSAHNDLADFIKKLEPEIEQENQCKSEDITCPLPVPSPSQSVLHVHEVIIRTERGNLFYCMYILFKYI